VAAEWKDSLLPGASAGTLPEGYRREDGVVGREDLLGATDHRFWADSEFVARSKIPHTTSAVEAEIRRRQLEQLVHGSPIDPKRPALELGCADGLVTRHLLELGFEKLVSTDIVHPTVARLEQTLTPPERDRVLLVVDDVLRLPLDQGSFDTVIAWGVLSVSGDFERALELAWSWVTPGGHLLLAEPLLESVLVYALVRGDLDEFRRIRAEGTRAAMWDKRADRYGVNTWRFYEDRLAALHGSAIADRGGVNMLPSLVLGGVVQDSPVDEAELSELSELLTDPALDELNLWRQAYWLVRKG
jgi:SAM-dependent methyltransferase